MPPSAGNLVVSDYKAALLADVTNMDKKFLDLAQAFPADKYTWRPGEGVRSVSEVFLRVSGRLCVAAQLRSGAPEGFSMNGYEKSTTNKAKVVDQLNQGFACCFDPQ